MCNKNYVYRKTKTSYNILECLITSVHRSWVYIVDVDPVKKIDNVFAACSRTYIIAILHQCNMTFEWVFPLNEIRAKPCSRK
jgi:hypothetical protein